MEVVRNEKSERTQIEEYLNFHCIEEMLDETVNTIVEQRPLNPFLEISKIIESKSLPEILSVSISSVLVAGFGCGIEAYVGTNLGQFKGSAMYADSLESSSLYSKDFTKLEDTLGSALKVLDPRDIIKVDTCLQEILKDDPALLLAMSMACCKAGARSKGLPVYKYLSEISGTEMCLPIPVPTVVTRILGNSDSKLFQQVFLFPSAATDLKHCMETMLEASKRVNTALRESPSLAPTIVHYRGTIRVNSESIEKVVKLVRGAVTSDSSHIMRVGVDLHTNSVPNIVPVAYQADGGMGAHRSGMDVAESAIGLLRDWEVVSVEQPLELSDIPAMRAMREKLKQFMDSLQSDQTTEGLGYCLAGVGGQEGVPLQVVADHCTVADIRTVAPESLYNAVRVTLGKAGTISAAVALCKQARSAGWAILVGVSREYAECTDSFLADFAVGVGAGQLLAGGLGAGEYCCKYNRVREIAEEDSSINFAGQFFRR